MRSKNVGEGKRAEGLIHSFHIKGKFVAVRRKWRIEPWLYVPIQKHTSRIIVLSSFPYPPLIGDGVITNLVGVEVGVKTADCVPLVLIGEEWFGAVHVGWRGLSSGVVERALETISNWEDLRKVFAFIGPAAKGCCYEVGEEFREMFKNLEEREGKLYMDLQEEVLRRLKEAGVGSIGVYEVCTICSDLPSYRRDKTQDRLLTSVKALSSSPCP